MLSHNGPNRPESKTTHMIRPVRQAGAPVIMSAVSVCILLATPTDVAGLRFTPAFVYLSVCFFCTISQRPMKLGTLNLT